MPCAHGQQPDNGHDIDDGVLLCERDLIGRGAADERLGGAQDGARRCGRRQLQEAPEVRPNCVALYDRGIPRDLRCIGV